MPASLKVNGNNPTPWAGPLTKNASFPATLLATHTPLSSLRRHVCVLRRSQSLGLVSPWRPPSSINCACNPRLRPLQWRVKARSCSWATRTPSGPLAVARSSRVGNRRTVLPACGSKSARRNLGSLRQRLRRSCTVNGVPELTFVAVKLLDANAHREKSIDSRYACLRRTDRQPPRGGEPLDCLPGASQVVPVSCRAESLNHRSNFAGNPAAIEQFRKML